MSNLRSKSALGAANTKSLSRLEAISGTPSRTNMVISPSRSSMDGGNRLKSPSISVAKPIILEKKPSTSLSSVKGTVSAMSISAANFIVDMKNNSGDVHPNSDALQSYQQQQQFNQLDISQINAATSTIEAKNDVNGLRTPLLGNGATSGASALNTSSISLNNTSIIPKKTISSLAAPPALGIPLNQSFNGVSKSPSNMRRPDSTNGNLIQSVNFGSADINNTSMVLGGNTNTAMEPMVNFEVLKQFDQKQKSSNIKTFVRVRPLNKMEIEFNENGCGSENLRFPDMKSIQVMPEKALFTMDRVYPPDSEQEQIYENVGKEMVNDVLQGYNGTIFAYGPTGSGKTFTMFGDFNDAKKKGIIPRVSNQIFTYINSVEQDIEFIITCSMLEIYKENLFDLLKVDRVGLKIKENPQKGGIYVQGLTMISVDCEEEILDAINLGYQSKQTRETRMNEYSSRSHTIFTINVTQRYPNGQEKIGKLNLVDLAGSEKVGKTNATGETLEEAKKINLSLSCLGNVIHALTSSQEHIPYRDSKLTRILQESLGGNYKTSLIAAISPHSSQHEEQTSTLKFATRAKTIKNQVKMNVKLSVEQMRKLIEQLKAEMEKAKAQNTRFRATIKKLRDELKAASASIMSMAKDGKVTEQQQQAMLNMRALEDILNVSELDAMLQDDETRADSMPKSGSKELDEDDDLDETNNNNVTAIDSDKAPMSQFSGKRNNSYKKGYGSHLNASPITGSHNNSGSNRGVNLDYKAAYLEKVSQCRHFEKEVMEMKKNLLEAERKLADIHEEKHGVEVKHTQQVTKNDFNQFQNEILQKQVHSLVDSICKQENQIGALMKEKQQLSQKKIDEFLKDKLLFSEIHFSDYFKNSINFNYDQLVQKWSDVNKNMKSIGIDDDDDLMKGGVSSSSDQMKRQNSHARHNSNLNSNNQRSPATVDDFNRGSFMGNLDFNSVSKPYDVLEEIVEFPGYLEKFNSEHPISRDLMIILLKKQLFNSHVINQHLSRTINALEWKQIIEYGKAKMKSVLNKIQATHISNLEQVISEASQNYRTLRNRIETVELETQFVKEKIDSFTDQAPKKSKIIKDTESIRHLLMKPSNDGIRQSLRGSLIGFDKTIESPIMKVLKETDELLAKEFLPLTYDRAVEELKQRNALLRRAYAEFKGNYFNGLNQEFIEQVLKEKERLEGKITSLQNELTMEIGKSDHYADMQKEQTKELERFLVTKMKEESEQLEKTQKKISDQHESEILKYQQSFNRMQEKFAEFIRVSFEKIEGLKRNSTGNSYIAPAQLDSVLQEMQAMKEQYNRIFNFDDLENVGGSSPKSIMNRFNPTSMIFKSFESAAESSTHSAIFGSNAMPSNSNPIRIDEGEQSATSTFQQQQQQYNNIPLQSQQTIVPQHRSRYDVSLQQGLPQDEVNEQQQHVSKNEHVKKPLSLGVLPVNTNQSVVGQPQLQTSSNDLTYKYYSNPVVQKRAQPTTATMNGFNGAIRSSTPNGNGSSTSSSQLSSSWSTKFNQNRSAVQQYLHSPLPNGMFGTVQRPTPVSTINTDSTQTLKNYKQPGSLNYSSISFTSPKQQQSQQLFGQRKY